MCAAGSVFEGMGPGAGGAIYLSYLSRCEFPSHSARKSNQLICSVSGHQTAVELILKMQIQPSNGTRNGTLNSKATRAMMAHLEPSTQKAEGRGPQKANGSITITRYLNNQILLFMNKLS